MSAGTPTLAQGAAAMGAGTLSAADLLGQVLDRLRATEPVLHAYAFVDEDGARAAAARADRERTAGTVRGPLHGIPVAVKDVIAVAGLPLEAGSAALRGRVADRDADVVARLREAGAVVVGKTVTHELAYGQNTPPTRNAHDPEREPGGSSAGSAVAVAAGSALAAIGTDGGGSVRHPAALNGVVGLKPTLGLVATGGVLTAGPSLEHVGPLARTVADCALVLAALTGTVSAPRRPADLAGARIGVLRAFVDACDPDARAAFGAACDVLAGLGARLVDVTVPELELAVPVGLALTLPEAADAHGGLLRAAPDALAAGTRAMLAAGELVPARDHLLARRARVAVRDALRRTVERERLDALACPSAPAPAGPAQPDEPAMTRLAAPLRIHMWANVTGVPAVSVPSGRAADGMPLGLQLAAAPFADAQLLAIAWAYERAAQAAR